MTESLIAEVETGMTPTGASRSRLPVTTIAGLVGVVIVLASALLAPVIAPADPNAQDLTNLLAPPMWADGGSSAAPLGTDGLGRDVASRLLFGARNSLLIAFGAMMIGATLGLATGLAAGFFGGKVDAIIMRVGDVQLAFPFILLAIAVLGLVPDRSAWHLILVLGIPGWIVYARMVRSRVLAEKSKDYVTAARAVGASRFRRLVRYVLPSVWLVIPVIALLDVGFLIIMESTLSFLGLGLPPPATTWGGILAEGRRNMVVSTWLPILPGLAILITVLSINLLGDGLASSFDVSLTRSGSRRVLSKVAPVSGQRVDVPTDGAVDVSTDSAGNMRMPLLVVDSLSVEFPSPSGAVRAVRDVSFTLDCGETLGIVGESGSGKSVTASSVIQLIDPPGRVTSGRIWFEGEDLAQVSDGRMRRLRGRKIAMIFQNPTASLNPVFTIGHQMREVLKVAGTKRRDMASTIAGVLTRVGIPDPSRIVHQYPFELSGGMNQRVMIGMALAARPKLLIADEPTTALDATTQKQILTELTDLTNAEKISLLLITHDIALVAEFAERVLVLYAGEVCEVGPAREVIERAAHPYTKALLESVPRVDSRSQRLEPIPGELPDPARPRTGCPFASRCPDVMDVCYSVDPEPVQIAMDHLVACHLVDRAATVGAT